jgi:prepilin-type N-terminal cleavage/methylation domain-containing protein
MFTNREHRRAAGFTLLEVTVALAVLLLVAGCIYGVLRGTLELTAGLSEQRTRQEQLDGVVELCRRTLRMLPAEALLEGRTRRVDGQLLPELIIRNAPELLAWERVTDWAAVSALGLRPQLGGLFSLALLRTTQPEDIAQDPVAAADAGEWLTLVPNLKKITWRYFDSRSGLWLDDFPVGNLRPDAVELTLWLAEEEEPLRMVFWVVPMARNITVRTLPREGR